MTKNRERLVNWSAEEKFAIAESISEQWKKDPDKRLLDAAAEAIFNLPIQRMKAIDIVGLFPWIEEYLSPSDIQRSTNWKPGMLPAEVRNKISRTGDFQNKIIWEDDERAAVQKEICGLFEQAQASGVSIHINQLWLGAQRVLPSNRRRFVRINALPFWERFIRGVMGVSNEDPEPLQPVAKVKASSPKLEEPAKPAPVQKQVEQKQEPVKTSPAQKPSKLNELVLQFLHSPEMKPILDEFVSALGLQEKLHQMVQDRVAVELSRRLWNGAQTPPPSSVTSPERHIYHIAICGLRKHQPEAVRVSYQDLIKNEEVRFTFYDKLGTNQLVSADDVIGMTEWITHAADGKLMDTFKLHYHRCIGSVDSCKRKISELLRERKIIE